MLTNKIAEEDPKALNNSLKEIESLAKNESGVLDEYKLGRMRMDFKKSINNLQACDHVPNDFIKQAAAKQKSILNSKYARAELLTEAFNVMKECVDNTKKKYEIGQPGTNQ